MTSQLRKNSIKVALVTPSLYAAGGAEYHIACLARGLKSYGFETIVFCAYRSKKDSLGLSSHGVPVIDFFHPQEWIAKKINRRPRSGKTSSGPERLHITRKGIRRVLSLLNEVWAVAYLTLAFWRHRIKIVYASQYYSKAALLAGRLAGADVLVYTHRNLVSQRHSSVDIRILSYCCRMADAVVVPSEAVRKDFIEQIGVRGHDVFVVPNGIDGTSLEKQPFQKRKTLVVGMAANLTPVKGFEYFLQAAQIILYEFPNVQFKIAGEGPLLGELKDLSKKLGISHNISFIGLFRGDQERAKFYCDLDVFVLSSLGESFSYVCAEAMAAGRPVVATRVGGIPEVVTEGVSGLLVEPEDPKALAQEVCKLLLDNDLRRSMGDEGRNIIETRLSLEKHLESIAKLFKEKLQGSLL